MDWNRTRGSHTLYRFLGDLYITDDDIHDACNDQVDGVVVSTCSGASSGGQGLKL